MLTEAIMHDCVVKLLKNHDEESLECLCRLLTTIGKDLDFEKAKVNKKSQIFRRFSLFEVVRITILQELCTFLPLMCQFDYGLRVHLLV